VTAHIYCVKSIDVFVRASYYIVQCLIFTRQLQSILRLTNVMKHDAYMLPEMNIVIIWSM